MDIEDFRSFCLSLPETTEDLKWDNVLCFCVVNKIFALVPLDKLSVSFKIDPEDFETLVARNGFEQAYHLKKGQWASIQHFEVTNELEIKQLIKNSYVMVVKKLPKKYQNNLLKKL